MMNSDDRPSAWAGVVLRCVPSNREPRQTVAQIAARARSLHAPAGRRESLVATQTVIDLLRAFGVLDETEEGIRAASQMPAYFLGSLEWYVRHQEAMLEGWREPLGRASAAQGPRLLLHIEQRRISLAESLGLEAPPLREQHASLVLVKAMLNRESHFLFIWDAGAAQFQLVGGRIEPGETPAQAAAREFQEEIGDAQSPRLCQGRDYEIKALAMNDGRLSFQQLSPTYGVYTDYTFYAFTARIHAAHFTLGIDTRWVSRAEMLRGEMRDGARLASPLLFRKLLGALAGGVRRVPASFVL